MHRAAPPVIAFDAFQTAGIKLIVRMGPGLLVGPAGAGATPGQGAGALVAG